MKLERIHQIAVFARDLDEAISFYRDTLGATYLTKFDPPGLVFFDFGGTRVLLEKTGPKASVYFRVDDIHAAYQELSEKGVKFIAEPHMIFSGRQRDVWYCRRRRVDGFLFGSVRQHSGAGQPRNKERLKCQKLRRSQHPRNERPLAKSMLSASAKCVC